MDFCTVVMSDHMLMMTSYWRDYLLFPWDYCDPVLSSYWWIIFMCSNTNSVHMTQQHSGPELLNPVVSMSESLCVHSHL